MLLPLGASNVKILGEMCLVVRFCWWELAMRCFCWSRRRNAAAVAAKLRGIAGVFFFLLSEAPSGASTG